MAEYEKNINANVFKYNAYIRAATSLMNCPIQIKSGAQAMSLVRIWFYFKIRWVKHEWRFFFCLLFKKDGIGKRIALRIDQYLKTRRMYELEKVSQTSHYLNRLAVSVN